MFGFFILKTNKQFCNKLLNNRVFQCIMLVDQCKKNINQSECAKCLIQRMWDMRFIQRQKCKQKWDNLQYPTMWLTPQPDHIFNDNSISFIKICKQYNTRRKFHNGNKDILFLINCFIVVVIQALNKTVI